MNNRMHLTRYGFCLLLALLACTGCRKELNDPHALPPVAGEVRIVPQWGVLDPAAQLNLLLYKEGEAVVRQTLPGAGGVLSLLPGSYRLLLFHYSDKGLSLAGHSACEDAALHALKADEGCLMSSGAAARCATTFRVEDSPVRLDAPMRGISTHLMVNLNVSNYEQVEQVTATLVDVADGIRLFTGELFRHSSGTTVRLPMTLESREAGQFRFNATTLGCAGSFSRQAEPLPVRLEVEITYRSGDAAKRLEIDLTEPLLEVQQRPEVYLTITIEEVGLEAFIKEWEIGDAQGNITPKQNKE